MNTYHAASWSDPYSSSGEKEIYRYTILICLFILAFIFKLFANYCLLNLLLQCKHMFPTPIKPFEFHVIE